MKPRMRVDAFMIQYRWLDQGTIFQQDPRPITDLQHVEFTDNLPEVRKEFMPLALFKIRVNVNPTTCCVCGIKKGLEVCKQCASCYDSVFAWEPRTEDDIKNMLEFAEPHQRRMLARELDAVINGID